MREQAGIVSSRRLRTLSLKIDPESLQKAVFFLSSQIIEACIVGVIKAGIFA